MIIVYRPDGGEERRWDLSQTRIMAVEAEEIERLTSLTWNEARAKLTSGSMLALRAVAYVLAKRDQPALRYSQFNPPVDGLDWEMDRAERNALRRDVLAADISEQERAAILADLDELDAKDPDTATAEQVEAADPEAVPKDSAPAPSLTAA